MTITIPIGLFILLPFLGVPIVVVVWKIYGTYIMRSAQIQVDKAKKELKKIEQQYMEMEDNYKDMKTEIKGAIDAYNELRKLL